MGLADLWIGSPGSSTVFLSFVYLINRGGLLGKPPSPVAEDSRLPARLRLVSESKGVEGGLVRRPRSEGGRRPSKGQSSR